MALRLRFLNVVLLLLLLPRAAHADNPNPAFDLAGPQIDVRVTRAGKMLPIANVPNLAPGDRLWVHPNFPPQQSVHYLLIIAFLRGTTNPPPESWFIKAETWTKAVRQEGIYATVPADAQQVVLFLAPETSGDFSTLRNAVRGRPGAFVRASQDLNQASLDRERLDKYLATVRDTSELNPKALEERSTLLARSLNIRLDHQCFDKPTDQQAPCLVGNTSQLVLDDGHSQSVVASLTSGSSSDLLAQASYTRTLGGGSYSAYIGAIVDMARIADSLHTAAFQYLPALAIPNQDTLNLKLNTPPSFHNPKSVLVVALPAVDSAKLPPLRAVDPKQISCLQKASLVLQVDGAPLAFATAFAHDLSIRVATKAGQSVELPAVSDPARGGFVVDTKALPEKGDSEVTGVLHGFWGFQPFDGPTFRLQNARPAQWSLAASDQSALILGRKDTLHLQSEQATCVDDIQLKDSDGKKLDTTWKVTKRDEIQVDVPLENAKGGTLTMQIRQAGLAKADELPLHTYSEAGHLDSFTLYADDPEGVLKGTRLDEVESLDLNGVRFKPAGLSREGQEDSLKVAAATPGATSALQAQAGGRGEGRAERRARPEPSHGGERCPSQGHAPDQERSALLEPIRRSPRRSKTNCPRMGDLPLRSKVSLRRTSCAMKRLKSPAKTDRSTRCSALPMADSCCRTPKPCSPRSIRRRRSACRPSDRCASVPSTEPALRETGSRWSPWYGSRNWARFAAPKPWMSSARSPGRIYFWSTRWPLTPSSRTPSPSRKRL